MTNHEDLKTDEDHDISEREDLQFLKDQFDYSLTIHFLRIGFMFIILLPSKVGRHFWQNQLQPCGF